MDIYASWLPDHLYYFVHLLLWMGPIVLLQWAFFHRILWPNLRAILLPTVLIGTYLVGTDAVAVPAELESPRAKLVYLFLSTRGESSVSELQKGLEMKKISLYSILGTLCKRGLVSQDAERYRID